MHCGPGPLPGNAVDPCAGNGSATALTDAELAHLLRRIGGFESRPLIAVAVSGGPDSLALTLLADRWARAAGGIAWGLHVDHRLRPESGDEAAIVGRWLAARGIPYAVLPWEGEKPAGGIQEAARAARYRLLTDWCHRHGCLHLLTAHHRDDQLETHLIRRRAGSGPDGLAAMSAVRELQGCRLIRPLLNVPRVRLAAVLATADQPFLTDPSNHNPRFERARLREANGAGADSETSKVALSDAVRAIAEHRIERERQLNRLLAQAVALHPSGFAAIATDAVAHPDSDLAERLLARVVACIGGGHYPARRERVIRLRSSMIAAPERARTLAGCRLVPWRGKLLVLRELAAAEAALMVKSGTTSSWDRRFEIACPIAAGTAFTIGYLADEPVPSAAKSAGDLPRLIHRTLAALWDDEGLAALPHLGYRRPEISSVPRISFRPANPLTRAGFTVV